jgi:Rad3-related DNA helicase
LFRNNVITFEEAHNFPEQCCDDFMASASFRSFHETAEVCTNLERPELGDLVRGGVNIGLVTVTELAPKLRRLDGASTEIEQRERLLKLRARNICNLTENLPTLFLM